MVPSPVRLCVQVMDPVRASYGVDNAMYAVGQLAQTTMRRWGSHVLRL
jgi:regulator of protease activity HflC (stomatin/prohibitin superfamily)